MPHRQDRDAKPHLGGQVTVERGLTAHGPTSDAQGMPASYGAVEPAAGRRARPAGMMGEKALAARVATFLPSMFSGISRIKDAHTLAR
jgi:hypothetical protein